MMHYSPKRVVFDCSTSCDQVQPFLWRRYLLHGRNARKADAGEGGEESCLVTTYHVRRWELTWLDPPQIFSTH